MKEGKIGKKLIDERKRNKGKIKKEVRKRIHKERK